MEKKENQNRESGIEGSRPVRFALSFLAMIVILACRTSRQVWTPEPFPQPEVAITAETISQVQELAQLPQPGAVHAMAWSPDGSILAVYTSTYSDQQWYGKVQLWNATTGAPYDTFEVTGIYQLAISPNGEMLVGIGHNGLYIWRLTDRTELIQMLENQRGGWQIAFTADGSRLAVGHETIIQLLEMPSGELLGTFSLKRGEAQFAFYSGEPLLLVASKITSLDPIMTIWDINTGLEIETYMLPIDLPIEIGRAILLPDQMQAALPIKSETLGIIDLRSGDLLLEWDGFRFDVPRFAFSPDGRVLAAGEGVGFEVASPSRLRLLDIQSEQEVPMLRGHKNVIVNLAFSPDGRLLATASEDGSIRLWGVPPRNKE